MQLVAIKNLPIYDDEKRKQMLRELKVGWLADIFIQQSCSDKLSSP